MEQCSKKRSVLQIFGVDMIMLDQTDQEHQILKNLGDVILE